MTSALVIGVGVAAAAFFVSSIHLYFIPFRPWTCAKLLALQNQYQLRMRYIPTLETAGV